MDQVVQLDDHRGVDVAQIRALLRLTPAQRIAHMVAVATRMRSIADNAKASRQ